MDQLRFAFHRPLSGCFAALPPEIISAIFLTISDDFGLHVRPRWVLPLRLRRVSRHFLRIADNTPGLWRYLYICQPIHKYLHNHIARSEPFSLLAEVEYNGEPDGSDEGDSDSAGEGWRELVGALIPAIPRLASLGFCSAWDNDPVIEVLRYKMPNLMSLDVLGRVDDLEGDPLPVYELPSSHVPLLRSLRSTSFFHWQDGWSVPRTVEKLCLHMDEETAPRSFGGFWNFLPPDLRVLEIEYLTRDVDVPPPSGKLLLPRLTEIHFSSCHSAGDLHILPYLDAPRLRILTVKVGHELEGISGISWPLRFPALACFKWESPFQAPPLLGDLLRECEALTSVDIRTGGIRVPPVPAFVGALSRDSSLLPRLEALTVFGSSILYLKRVVQARPGLKRLTIHQQDLELPGWALEESPQAWDDCVEWLKSNVELKADIYDDALSWKIWDGGVW